MSQGAQRCKRGFRQPASQVPEPHLVGQADHKASSAPRGARPHRTSPWEGQQGAGGTVTRPLLLHCSGVLNQGPWGLTDGSREICDPPARGFVWMCKVCVFSEGCAGRRTVDHCMAAFLFPGLYLVLLLRQIFPRKHKQTLANYFSNAEKPGTL